MGQSKTRLNRIHPYPGMIADELAMEITAKYVRVGDLVLDPFVGTGRTLAAAAARGAFGIGIDVNPLAVVVANAKAVTKGTGRLRKLSQVVKASNFRAGRSILRELPNRSVAWFPPRSRRELELLIRLINRQALPQHSLVVVAAVLCATIRDVSYCRKDQWKLHRLNEAERASFYRSVKDVFVNRLENACDEIENVLPRGAFRVFAGDSRNISRVLPAQYKKKLFDCVITSPPYGDSRTTVQYGGMSQLCLDVASKLKGVPEFANATGHIDRRCLGGEITCQLNKEKVLRRFWSGDLNTLTGRRVSQFLSDLAQVCQDTMTHVRAGGLIVFVVARRTVGGQVLNLDKWLTHRFCGMGCTLEEKRERTIQRKLTPYMINSKARCNDRSSGNSQVSTMKREYVLVFKVKRRRTEGKRGQGAKP